MSGKKNQGEKNKDRNKKSNLQKDVTFKWDSNIIKISPMPLHKHHKWGWGVRCFPNIAKQWKHMAKATL